MICKSCGRANELGARFCKSCGAPLESDESMQQNNTYQSENVCQQNNQYVMPESMYSGTTKSRACAVIITAYSIINFIYVILLSGMPGGWLIIVCGVYSIIYTFKYQNAWNKYQQTGQI